MSREMKDSAIKWIGEIPENWGVSKLKTIGNTKSGLANKKPEDFGHGYPFISYKNVYSNIIINKNYPDLVESTEIDRTNFNVLKGDTFFTGSSETIKELGFASMCLEDIPNATYNGFCIRFRPNSFENYNLNFMKYNFRSEATRGYLIQNDNSITRANLSQKVLKIMPVVIPSIKEQQKIAEYLDKKVTLIDNIITKTTLSIKEYKKYKQSVITEAVTKGLNPKAEMKDSGIKWIGEIPKEWNIKRIKHCCKLKNGTTPSTSQIKYFNGDVNWFTPSDFKSSFLLKQPIKTLSELAITNGIISLYPEKSILLICIGGTVGKIGYIDKKGYSNQQITALIPRDIYYKYLLYYLVSKTEYIKDNALYTTLPIINISYLKDIPILAPSKTEQKQIVDYLDQKCSTIDNLITQKQQLLRELEAYKKSLIYECVTGKRELS
ncbi:restriction endonuclease subunit S [Clostridium algoriphilum]|uniref:restriction endonuclease subunit S n=1 Tax=Clostridium algoriphilum TaxID=198347 RepID=UPI001CF31E31|nr:restriction endonuclease subunit S [Clostridium algoriphilum]MCB2292433.1 restriction endonuclease subunit S [Clostridium algoriphilum]